MNLNELLKAMFRAFFVITTGITISMYVCCLLFSPDARLTPADIGGILLLAFITDLTFFLFYSKRELSKKQMLLRFFIHLPILLGILLNFAHLWDWVNMNSTKEVAVFLLLVFGIYAAVLAVTFYQDKKTAEKLNDGLKKRFHS